jgi:hypothetical protein
MKSTPRSFIDAPSLWSKVAQKAPHFLDSKRKFFCRLTFPYILVCAIQVYFQRDDCHAFSDEVDAIGPGLCFDPIADFLNISFFLTVQCLGYLIRKELILGSPVIFSFVEQMKKNPRDDEQLQSLPIKSEKEWVNVLMGRQERFRPWNIRGHVLFPMCTFLGFFFGLLYQGYYQKYGDIEDKTCVSGYSFCGPDNVYVLSNVSVFMIALRYSVSWSFVTYAIMTGAYPLILVSLIVGPSAKSRIGLWNQGDVSLGEVQRISMHASLYMSGAAFVLILYTFYYAGTGPTARIIYILLLLGIILAVLFVPIVPAILALRNIKEKDLADISALEERANKNYFDLLRDGVKGRLKMKPGEVERAEAELARIVKYRLQVQNASVVPSSLELIKTYMSSVFVGVVLPFVISTLL